LAKYSKISKLFYEISGHKKVLKMFAESRNKEFEIVGIHGSKFTPDTKFENEDMIRWGGNAHESIGFITESPQFNIISDSKAPLNLERKFTFSNAINLRTSPKQQVFGTIPDVPFETDFGGCAQNSLSPFN
jgi:hypothetical protein